MACVPGHERIDRVIMPCAPPCWEGFRRAGGYTGNGRRRHVWLNAFVTAWTCGQKGVRLDIAQRKATCQLTETRSPASNPRLALRAHRARLGVAPVQG